jgi:hypothetical protein
LRKRRRVLPSSPADKRSMPHMCLYLSFRVPPAPGAQPRTR